MVGRNVYLLYSEDVCLVYGCFALYIVGLYISFLPAYVFDCIYADKNPLNTRFFYKNNFYKKISLKNPKSSLKSYKIG